jgi:hypothetical protein
LYSSPYIIRVVKSRRTRWEGHVTHDIRNSYKIFVGNPEGKRPLGISRHRWEDIVIDLREIRWGGVDWIHLAQDKGPVAGCFEHGNEPLGSIKSGEFLDYLSDY